MVVFFACVVLKRDVQLCIYSCYIPHYSIIYTLPYSLLYVTGGGKHAT